jgi:hypothetical protein
VLRVFFVALLVAAVLFLPLGRYVYAKGTERPLHVTGAIGKD